MKYKSLEGKVFRSTTRPPKSKKERRKPIKIEHGLYYYPKNTVFGDSPPKDEDLLKVYLEDSRFLCFSPNLFNSLRLGTTQLYNKSLVYNLKITGRRVLLNRVYEFRKLRNVPEKLTYEILIVLLLNDIEQLAEDDAAMRKALRKNLETVDDKVFDKSLKLYGNLRAKREYCNILRNIHV